MNNPMSSRGNHGDQHARLVVPLSGRRGVLIENLPQSREERPVDTIAVARKVAEEL
ncbi:hypothetical protein [Amycolatopsis taiwanensis]|uniref:hypothetical protein n=1 Tax=Amycolatopsis taiwanensis TaxID=342230 RepID=UPI0025578D52|nr:hypothetical protein [Amycolatopsis taiwanensis]